MKLFDLLQTIGNDTKVRVINTSFVEEIICESTGAEIFSMFSLDEFNLLQVEKLTVNGEFLQIVVYQQNIIYKGGLKYMINYEYHHNDWVAMYVDECGDIQVLPFDSKKQADDFLSCCEIRVGVMTTAFYNHICDYLNQQEETMYTFTAIYYNYTLDCTFEKTIQINAFELELNDVQTYIEAMRIACLIIGKDEFLHSIKFVSC